MRRRRLLRTALGAGGVLLAGLPWSVHAALPETIARVKPSIVVVGSYRATDSPRLTLRGAGFAVGNGRLIVTNAHVLGDAGGSPARGDRGTATPAERNWRVQSRDAAGRDQLQSAVVLEIDPVHDLALLRIDGDALPALALHDSDRVREGQAAAFIGFPIGNALGFAPVTHRALVSSIAPVSLPAANSQQLNAQLIRSLRSGSFDIFQLDATAYPGNSGGPLFDPDSGEVLGVLNMVFIKSTREAALSQPSGISYAIPSNHVRELLKRHGNP